MKKLFALILALCMVFSLVACGSTENNTENTGDDASLEELDPITITFAHCNATESYPAKGVDALVAAIEARSEGKIKFEVYPNGQLGGYVELTESMATGGLDMGELDPTLMTEYAPELPMLIQPFLVKDYAHFGRILQLDAVKDAEATLAQNNITTLGYMYCGFRSMCAQKEIHNVADCSGIIIRSPEADIYMNTLKTLGMAPTPMAMSEMYTAMKSGVIQGAEPAVSAIWDNSLYEVCPYILRSNHMFSFNNIVISTKLWDSLPELYKTIISEEVQKACEQEQKDMEAGEQEYFDKLADAGCTVTEWDNYQELVDLFTPSWEQTATSIGGNAPALLQAMKDCA